MFVFEVKTRNGTIEVTPIMEGAEAIKLIEENCSRNTSDQIYHFKEKAVAEVRHTFFLSKQKK